MHSNQVANSLINLHRRINVAISLVSYMTKLFESLQNEPQPKINRGDLNFDERSKLRVIKIVGNSGRSAGSPGIFTNIYYIEGDEKRAAERFVEENEEQLQKMDFSKNRNPIQANVCREIYDWILHFFGERQIRKFDTVVIEKRSDGTIWVLDREHFKKDTERRYTVSDQVAAQIEGETLRSIYEQCGETISESDLRDIDAITGHVQVVLDAYRSASEFDCEPIRIGRELAVQKN